MTGNVDEAKAQYARALRLKPNNVAAYVLLLLFLVLSAQFSDQPAISLTLPPLGALFLTRA